MQVDHTKLVKTVSSIIKNEGFSGFYKGILGPICSVPALNSLVFASYSLSKKFLEAHGHDGYEASKDINKLN
jgi:Mitochondrial carrier protein